MLIVACALLALVPPGPGDWRWPLTPPPQVLRAYDPPPRPWLAGHRGVDLAARPGQPVYAAGAGTVSYAGRLAGRGVVTLLHGVLRTTYLPVRPSVRLGQRVSAGDRLGVVEDVRGHCGPRLCLHWGLRRDLAYLDPLSLLGRGTLRLLPIWETQSARGSTAHEPDAADVPTTRHRGSAPTSGPPPVTGIPVEREHSTTPVSATTAAGGAVAGAILAYGLSAARHRPPPQVIDLVRERKRRRPRPTRGDAPDGRPA